MNELSFVKCLAVLASLWALPASAQVSVPSCSDWLQGDRAAKSCSCAGSVRSGDDRAKPCASVGAASTTAAPVSARAPQSAAVPAARAAGVVSGAGAFDGAARPEAPTPKFGVHSVTLSGGYITGADGSGVQNGSVAVEFYRQKTRAGAFSAEAEIGRYRMGGIPINDSQDVGVVGQLPDGTPVNGTVVTTGRSPAVSYIPLADFKYQPPVRLGRVHPYAVGEFGLSRLSSTNAKVDSTLIATVGGQPVFTQDLGPSLQPTGESRNHPGGGFGGGVKVDLTKRLALDGQFLDAPTGYKVFKYGLTLNLDRKRKDAAADTR